jgi:protein disulfide-isomerase
LSFEATVGSLRVFLWRLNMVRQLTVACIGILGFASAGLGAEPNAIWIEDFTVARQAAQQHGKDLLILFTGSDWCPYCTKLDDQILSREPFKREAAKEFIFVRLDYPRTRPQDPAIKAQNQKLGDLYSSRFNLQGFPTIYLADPNGAPYAQTGLNEMGPGQYAEQLHAIRAEHLKAKRPAGGDPNSQAR